MTQMYRRLNQNYENDKQYPRVLPYLLNDVYCYIFLRALKLKTRLA